MTVFQCEQLTRYYYFAVRDGWERNRQILTAFGAKKESIVYEWDRVETAAMATIPTDAELAAVEEWVSHLKKA